MHCISLKHSFIDFPNICVEFFSDSQSDRCEWCIVGGVAGEGGRSNEAIPILVTSRPACVNSSGTLPPLTHDCFSYLWHVAPTGLDLHISEHEQRHMRVHEHTWHTFNNRLGEMLFKCPCRPSHLIFCSPTHFFFHAQISVMH